MIWVGALVQSIILTVVTVGFIITLGVLSDSGSDAPEGFHRWFIISIVASVISWIVFGWVLALR